MFSRRSLCAPMIVCAVLAANASLWPADLPAIAAIPNQNVLISQIVRVVDVNALTGSAMLGFFGPPTGADPLEDGQVSVRRDRRITFQIRGAATRVTYAAALCRFGFPSAPGCVSVGQLSTDSDGDANATFDFPTGIQGSDTWTGQFLLTRNNAAQFISGFSFPPTTPKPSTAVELQITGQIQSVSDGTRSFHLAGLPLAIGTDNFTKFDGKGSDSLSDLRPGDEVQVTGFTRPDSTIYATHVRLTSTDNR